MHRAYLAFGSNMGDSVKTIEDALDALEAHPSVTLLRTSGLYETKAMYVEDQADFVNGACEVGWRSPHKLAGCWAKTNRAIIRLRLACSHLNCSMPASR